MGWLGAVGGALCARESAAESRILARAGLPEGGCCRCRRKARARLRLALELGARAPDTLQRLPECYSVKWTCWWRPKGGWRSWCRSASFQLRVRPPALRYAVRGQRRRFASALRRACKRSPRGRCLVHTRPRPWRAIWGARVEGKATRRLRPGCRSRICEPSGRPGFRPIAAATFLRTSR